MSRWLERLTRTPKAAQLRVDADALRWQGQGMALQVELSAQEPGWDAALARLGAAGPAAAVDVSVADHWCRWGLVEPPDGLRRLPDLRAFAAARLQAGLGLDAGAWLVDCEVPRGPQLFSRAALRLACCALPLPLLTALHDAAQAQGWRLRCIVPASAAACGEWLRQQPARDPAPQWWAGLSAGHALLAVARQGRLLALQQHWLQPTQESALAEQLQAALQRWAPVLGLPLPNELWAADGGTGQRLALNY